MKRKILCAAIKTSIEIFSLPAPARHSDIFLDMARKQVDRDITSQGEQGFLTDDNIFVNRIQGGAVALQAKQIQKLKWPPNL